LISAAGAVKEATWNSDASGALDDLMKKQRKEFNTNFQIRVLREILDAPSSPLFLAYLHGKKYPPAILAVDPADREPTTFWTVDATKGGLWYSSYLKSAYDKGTVDVQPRLINADHYNVDTTIASNTELTGTTTFSFVPSRDTRVIDIF